MASLKMMLAGVAVMATRASAQETDDMGPAAFLWPEDRVWQGDWDNRGPCGSVAEPHNRTEFPMRTRVRTLVVEGNHLTRLQRVVRSLLLPKTTRTTLP